MIEKDLERITRIVNSGVDDFAVARTGSGAKGGGGFDDHDVSALKRQLPGHCDSHHPRSDHHTVRRFSRGCAACSDHICEIHRENPSSPIS